MLQRDVSPSIYFSKTTSMIQTVDRSCNTLNLVFRELQVFEVEYERIAERSNPKFHARVGWYIILLGLNSRND